MSEKITIYESIGGIDQIDALVDRFYDLMALEPHFEDLRSMLAKILLLIGWHL